MSAKDPIIPPTQSATDCRRSPLDLDEFTPDELAALASCPTMTPIEKLDQVTPDEIAALNARVFDFGGVRIGDSVSHNFRLTKVNAITATLSNGSVGYSITAPTFPISSLGGGESVQVTVQFAPQSTTDGGPMTVTFAGVWGSTSTAATVVLFITGSALVDVDFPGAYEADGETSPIAGSALVDENLEEYDDSSSGPVEFSLPQRRVPPPTELDYLVGRRALVLGNSNLDKLIAEHREEVKRVTRPANGSAEHRITEALGEKLLRRRPGALLEKAFRVFEPRGLWLRLRALEPLDESEAEERLEQNRLRGREVRQWLNGLQNLGPAHLRDSESHKEEAEASLDQRHLQRVQARGAVRAADEDEAHLDQRLLQLKRQLEDAVEDAAQDAEFRASRFRSLRDEFPQDTPKVGLLLRRRLVFSPVITALRRDDENFWSYPQLADLILLSNEDWSDDPCPTQRMRYQNAKGNLGNVLSMDDYRRNKLAQRGQDVGD